ncbi:hypothetical protein AVEN_64927-1 [Araneus ventricosus]|uniref:Uncharacterized protein n=1 Tax=Araneus ventricosus TaxID=182803 RepID=A0A4Y2TB68_ARAVE|nr:hypothetical protein AVEN_64927-1 [Araneus ventricosus]
MNESKTSCRGEEGSATVHQIGKHARKTYLFGRLTPSSHIRSGFRSTVDLVSPKVGHASGGRFRWFYHGLTWPHAKRIRRLSSKNNVLLSRLHHSSVPCLIPGIVGEGVASMLTDWHPSFSSSKKTRQPQWHSAETAPIHS